MSYAITSWKLCINQKFVIIEFSLLGFVLKVFFFPLRINIFSQVSLTDKSKIMIIYYIFYQHFAIIFSCTFMTSLVKFATATGGQTAAGARLGTAGGSSMDMMGITSLNS